MTGQSLPQALRARAVPPTGSLRRLAVVAALAAVTMSGCAGTGVDAQTNEQYQPGIGANVRTGDIQLFNALAVANADDSATLSVTILNRTDKPIRLTSASGRLSTGTKVTATTTPAIIDADETFATGPAGSVMLEADGLKAGQYVKLTMKFGGGDSVTVEAPVVARTAMYDDVDPGAGGTPSTPTAGEDAAPAESAAH